jgi:hypothetical protein
VVNGQRQAAPAVASHAIVSRLPKSAIQVQAASGTFFVVPELDNISGSSAR